MFIQIQWSHFARTGQRSASSESASHTALGYLSEAVVRYLHPRLITTAAYVTDAVLWYRRVRLLVRLWALEILFKQPSRGNLRPSSLRVVVEHSLRREIYVPATLGPVVLYARIWPAWALTVEFVDYVAAVDANLNMTVVPVLWFKHTPWKLFSGFDIAAFWFAATIIQYFSTKIFFA